MQTGGSSRFAGRVALVTGGGRGLGRAISAVLARDGAVVAVNDLDAARAQEAVDVITARGGRAVVAAFDVSRSADVDAGVAAVVVEHGRLDIVVNNAGVCRFPPELRRRLRAWDDARAAGRPWGSLGSTVSLTDDLWRQHMGVLLDGVFFVTRAALRTMEPRGSGSIVNVASMGAFQRAPTAPHYAAAKAAVVAFTRAVGLEVAGAGVRVNAVAPGPFDTEITGRLPAGVRSPQLDTLPLARLGDPEELANVVAFLASDEASFCLGEVFTVSGGT